MHVELVSGRWKPKKKHSFGFIPDCCTWLHKRWNITAINSLYPRSGGNTLRASWFERSASLSRNDWKLAPARRCWKIFGQSSAPLCNLGKLVNNFASLSNKLPALAKSHYARCNWYVLLIITVIIPGKQYAKRMFWIRPAASALMQVSLPTLRTSVFPSFPCASEELPFSSSHRIIGVEYLWEN